MKSPRRLIGKELPRFRASKACNHNNIQRTQRPEFLAISDRSRAQISPPYCIELSIPGFVLPVIVVRGSQETRPLPQAVLTPARVIQIALPTRLIHTNKIERDRSWPIGIIT